MKLIVVVAVLVAVYAEYAEPWGGGGGGAKKTALKINLNPPDEPVEETIDSLKDLQSIENLLRRQQDEDMLTSKQKLAEAQKIRIKEIVNGAFEAIGALIPNPIKSTIRKSLRTSQNTPG
jgi:hypothetical protein